MSNHELTVSGSSSDLSYSVALPPDQNPALVYLAGLNAESGRRTMRQALDVIAGLVSGGQANHVSFPWSALRFQHTQAIRAKLAETYKPATCNKMLCALRGTLEAAWQLGQMSAEDYHRAANVKNARGETVPAGHALTAGEIAALMTACIDDKTIAGVRDAALIAVMYASGLRVHEAVGLDLADYDRITGGLLARGKGKKERIVYLEDGAAEALGDWLVERGAEPGALFWPVNKGGNPQARRMTTQAVYNMLQKRAEQAHVREFSPHDLRRTFISDLLDAGADIVTVQKLAGHADVSTTARYDRRGEQAKKKAVSLLHVPYVARTDHADSQ